MLSHTRTHTLGLTRHLPRRLLSLLSLLVFLPWLASVNINTVSTGKVMAMATSRRLALRQKTRDMFNHAYSNYIKRAFPLDELTPLTCSGRGPDKSDPNNWNINDVCGGFPMTLIDSLDAIAIIGQEESHNQNNEKEVHRHLKNKNSQKVFHNNNSNNNKNKNNNALFQDAVHRIIEWGKKSSAFNVDSRVQVFEVSIRVLGGLLSGHLLASHENKALGYSLPSYKGELLHLAKDLGNRLMPAFRTKTGLPWPRINLRKGVLTTEVTDTCTAGAGTLILEFGMLSLLTGDDKYMNAAKKALSALWKRRSKIDLVGNTIDTVTGKWLQETAGIGAGIDSFYEYLLKAHILFGDTVYFKVFDKSYKAVMKHIKDADGYFYNNVNMKDGSLATVWVDSLSAFWPGMQVLAGDLDHAVKSHQVFFSIWRKFNAMPERFDFYNKIVNIAHYPLRPELIESTYFLYQATKNHYYLEVGARILEDIDRQARTPCGFASIKAVGQNTLDDRMESFFLSETLKYLYLLFDTDNVFNTIDSSFVFTTEAHVFPLPKKYYKSKNINDTDARLIAQSAYKKGKSNFKVYRICPIYQPPKNSFNYSRDFSITSAWLPVSLAEWKNINKAVGLPETSGLDMFHTNSKQKCSPVHHISNIPYVQNIGHTSSTKSSQTQQQPSLSITNQEFEIVVTAPAGHYLLKKRLEIYSFDNGLRANMLHGLTLVMKIKTKKAVYPLNPSDVLQVPQRGVHLIPETTSIPPAVALKTTQMLTAYIPVMQTWRSIPAVLASFGPTIPTLEFTSTLVPFLINQPAGSPSSKSDTPHNLSTLSEGCGNYHQVPHDILGHIVLIKRGGCSFWHKVSMAQTAGAVGVVISMLDDVLLGLAGPEVEDEEIRIPCWGISAQDAVLLIDAFTSPSSSSSNEKKYQKVIIKFQGETTISEQGSHENTEWEGVHSDMKLQVAGMSLQNLVIVKGKMDVPLTKSASLRFSNSNFEGRYSAVLDVGQSFFCLSACPLLQQSCCSHVVL